MELAQMFLILPRANKQLLVTVHNQILQVDTSQ